jgi:hypothetical protein
MTLAFFLWWLRLFGGVQSALATNFSPVNDPQNLDPYGACVHRDLTVHDMGVASWKLPCRSRVVLYNPRTKRWTVAEVMDRGPGHKNGIDLAPAVTKALQANGKEWILVFPIKE